MKNLKFSLINNDFVIDAKTNLSLNDENDVKFTTFLREIEQELVTGETLYLEIVDPGENPIVFEISHFE